MSNRLIEAYRKKRDIEITRNAFAKSSKHQRRMWMAGEKFKKAHPELCANNGA